MNVTVSGWVYLPMSELSPIQIENMKRELSIYPRITTDIAGQKAPDPIFMFHEDPENNRFGIPRAFYADKVSGNHNEILDITYGNEMQKLETKFQAIGPFAEQEIAIGTLQHNLEKNKWGGAILNAGCAFGKGLANGEGVLTVFGYRPVESLIAGESKVVGTDGRGHLVTGVFPQGIMELYKIRFSDSTEIVCDKNHLWNFYCHGLRGEGHWIDVSYISELNIEKIIEMYSSGIRMTLPGSIPFDGRNGCPGHRYVVGISTCGFGHSTCISVDSDDKLFLTRNMIPTHNTVVACEIARRMRRSTLVFCHKEFLVEQWYERISEFMPDARIGRVKQKTCDYKDKDFVIALMQSLSREDGFRYPREFYDSTFGMVIGDELRRSGSGTWSRILPLFKSAYRVGLDATLRRADGAENAFWYHISDVTYKAKSEAMKPSVRWLKVDSQLRDIVRGSYRVKKENLSSAQILSQLAADNLRTRDIVDQIILAVKSGRKIIVMSERLEHLKEMADLLINALFRLTLPFIPEVDYYTGEWFNGEKYEKKTGTHKKGDLKRVKRTNAQLEKAKEANCIFATKQMVFDALDIPALDTMFFTLPIGDIEQGAGRVRRWCKPEKSKCEKYCKWRVGKCEGKLDAIIVDTDDYNIRALDSKKRRRVSFYKSIGAI